MDTSDEFVKMCRAAKEIQDAWEFEDGDLLSTASIIKLVDGIKLLWGIPEYWNREQAYDYPMLPPKDDITFIPRQDQLQEMCINLREFTPIFALECVTMWAEAPGVDCGSNDYAKSLNSFEQVWLAYVMDELYGKKWNGSEWA